MSSEDYLTRYFQQLGKVLAALIGFREEKKYALAIDEINQILDTWFHIPDTKIDTLTDEEFATFVFELARPGLEIEHSVAELLYQKAATFRSMNKLENMKSTASKALVVFQKIDAQSGSFSVEIQQRIAELNQMTSNSITR